MYGCEFSFGLKKLVFFFRALNQNEYNHITATYFLLAERKLRIQRIQNSHQLRGKNKKSPNDDEDELSSEATAASPSEVLSPLASPPLPPIQMTSSMPPPTYEFFFLLFDLKVFMFPPNFIVYRRPTIYFKSRNVFDIS